jgi:outer membrane lipoprotein LolB
MSALRRRLAVAAVALLAACASVPTETLAPGSFVVTGRVAVRYGKEAASGRVTWRHTETTDDLVISTPLGQGIAEITRRDGVYTLVAHNGERYRAADPEQLTEQALGWALPLRGLPDWLQGRPQPGIPAEVRRTGDRTAELRQLGWIIEYAGYDEEARLSKRLHLARGELDIRLAIESWQVGESSEGRQRESPGSAAGRATTTKDNASCRHDLAPLCAEGLNSCPRNEGHTPSCSPKFGSAARSLF